MKRVIVSVLILAVLTLFVVVQGILAGNAVRDFRTQLRERRADYKIIRERWKDLSCYLEFTVPRADLDAVVSDLDLLVFSEESGEEITLITERLDTSLRRIQDGFIPSFSGVF